MSGETAKQESGLTVDTLHLLMQAEFKALHAAIEQLHKLRDSDDLRYQQLRSADDLRYSQRFEAQGLALSAAAVAAKEAVAAALTSQQQAAAEQKEMTSKHFELVNGVNAQAQLDRGSYVMRPEYMSKIETLDVRINDVTKTLTTKMDDNVKGLEVRIEALARTSERNEGSRGGAVDWKNSIVQIVTIAIAALALYLSQRVK